MAAVSSLVVAAPAEAAPGTRCGFATVVGVRGSQEPAGTGTANGGRTYASGGLGPTVNAIIAGVQSDPNIPFYVEGLNYPAAILDPGNQQATNYISSLNIGVTNLSGEVNNLATSCPNTNIVLVGYSQGAHVINNVLANGYLTVNAKNHISAVVLVASPTFHGGDPWNAPGSPTGNGTFGSSSWPLGAYQRQTYIPPDYHLGYLPIVRSYCLSGDQFCQSNYTAAGAAIHGSYATNASIWNAALGFIYGWLTNNN
ncbi:cutinase family protein [Leifsonia sp. NPDC014704]|uniref:cutinase family protein n=1 Tax=Leifsonia sp. NPDC014704 TaxID=3364123 RepID=UPI0036F49991